MGYIDVPLENLSPQSYCKFNCEATSVFYKPLKLALLR